MKILTWPDRTFQSIPKQDNPLYDPAKPECIIICQQSYVQPPKINTGEYEAYHLKEYLGDYGANYIGLFWEIEDAELFAKAYSGQAIDKTEIEK